MSKNRREKLIEELEKALEENEKALIDTPYDMSQETMRASLEIIKKM